MGLGKKIVLEPLTEQRWSRIERQLFERVAREESRAVAPARGESGGLRWRTAVALVLAGSAAAATGAVAWHVTGSARGEVLAPSRIATDAAGSHVSVGEATLELAPRTTVAVSGDDAHGVTVQLESGRVECEVPPRRGRPPFEVDAADVAVRVVGTRFAVQREGTDVGVAVERGVVHVTRGGQELDLHAGDVWPPASPSAKAGAPSAGPSSAPGGSSTGPAPNVPPVATKAPAAPPSAREIYEAASRLEASRPDRAVALYRELAARGGPWGMNALFAQGRLEADRRNTAEARRVLEQYLARYPSGPNANDARQLLDRLR